MVRMALHLPARLQNALPVGHVQGNGKEPVGVRLVQRVQQRVFRQEAARKHGVAAGEVFAGERKAEAAVRAREENRLHARPPQSSPTHQAALRRRSARNPSFWKEAALCPGER